MLLCEIAGKNSKASNFTYKRIVCAPVAPTNKVVGPSNLVEGHVCIVVDKPDVISEYHTRVAAKCYRPAVHTLDC